MAPWDNLVIPQQHAMPRHRAVLEVPSQASALSSVFTIVNACVGAGVLSFPFAYSCTGWLAGVAITAAIAASESYTLHVLSRFAERTGSASYGELVLKVLGPGAAVVLSLVLLFYAWGSGVAYLIILGDCLRPLLVAGFGPAWFTDRRMVIALLSCSTILPLCFPRTLNALSGVSTVKFYGIIGVVAAIIFRSVQMLLASPAPWADARAFSITSNFWSALPIIVFGFQCHTNVVSVFNELCDAPALLDSARDSASLSVTLRAAAQLTEEGYAELSPGHRAKSRRYPRSTKLRGMTRVIALAISLVALFYSLTGVFGYLGFPTTAHSNILTNFPEGDPVMQVARGLVGIFMIAVYPLNHNPGRTAVKEMVLQFTGLDCAGSSFNALETLLFFGSNLAVALLVNDLGVIFQLVGGTCGAMLIFAFPGLLLLKYAHSKHGQPQQLEEPLLVESEDGAASKWVKQQLGAWNSLWASRTWGAGLGLLLVTLGLFVITVHSVASAAH